jgi:NAD(P)-dependent dehydrogenase (short-subunit alcohol dehydrogenase family)
MTLLKGKVIFLTGGSTGIGYECAKLYIKEGAKVIIADNKGISEVIKELGDEHLGIACDVSKASDVKSAIDKTLQQYGRMDAIHNNAGIPGPSKALHETTEKEWNCVININLKSVYHTIRYGFEALKETSGSILNTSSLVGEIGQSIHAVYTASKGGMNALTKSMALDYAKYNIRVNAVCPAAVWTPMLRRWCAEQPNSVGIEKRMDEIHALGYCPESDVIADVCAFLLSDKARFITGCIIPVSGGAELGYRR